MSGEPDTVYLPLPLRVPLMVALTVGGLAVAFVMDVVRSLRRRDAGGARQPRSGRWVRPLSSDGETGGSFRGVRKER